MIIATIFCLIAYILKNEDFENVFMAWFLMTFVEVLVYGVALKGLGVI